MNEITIPSWEELLLFRYSDYLVRQGEWMWFLQILTNFTFPVKFPPLSYVWPYYLVSSEEHMVELLCEPKAWLESVNTASI